MKAQAFSNLDAQDRPATRAIAKPSGGTLLVGLLMADLGLALIALAAWHALWTRAQAITHSAGGLLCCAGLILIWIGTTELAKSAHQQADKIKETTRHGSGISGPGRS